jgi:small-conductance mechanosensitive channel
MSFLATLPQLLIGLVIIGITWIATKVIRRVWSKIAQRMGIRKSLEELFKKLAFIGIWLIGIMIAAMTIFPDFTPANLITVVGLSSIAIGFAFKDIFENFLAGILILMREPFRINDFIECSDIEGQVQEITIRDTHIRQTDGQLVVLPNAMLFQNPVYVRTSQPTRRVTVMCGVAYDEDVDQAREIIRKAVENVHSVNKDKPVEIFAQSFGASSIDFEVTWWTGSRPLDIRKSRDEVVAAVKRALDDAGIEIPFPYRTLTFKEPLKLQQQSENGAPQSQPKKS